MTNPARTPKGHIDHSLPCAETTIADAWGNEHRYELYPVKAGVAFAQLEWLTGIAGSLAEIITSAFSAGKPTGAAFESMARIVFKQGGFARVAELMCHTARDGMRLADRNLLDRAYSMNLREMFYALAWTLREQYGDFFGDSSPSSGSTEDGLITLDTAKSLALTALHGLLNKHGLLGAVESLAQSSGSSNSTGSAP